MDAGAVDAVALEPGTVLREVLADGAHEQRAMPQRREAEGDVRRHPAAADLQVVHEERQGHPLQPLDDEVVGEPAVEGHEVVGRDGPGDGDTHGSSPYPAVASRAPVA